MEAFFADPSRIDLGVLIVDARHKPTSDDISMNQWFASSGCQYVVLANKLDKLKKSEIDSNLEQIVLSLNIDPEKLIPFSAEKGNGRDLLVAQILKFC